MAEPWFRCHAQLQDKRVVSRISRALGISTVEAAGHLVFFWGALAREVFKGQAERVFYFPFDWAWSVRRALSAISPSAVLVMETELWPRFFRECGRRGEISGGMDDRRPVNDGFVVRGHSPFRPMGQQQKIPSQPRHGSPGLALSNGLA